MVLDPNPFYHLLAIVRGPLMGQSPTLFNWIISLTMAIFGWLLAIKFFDRFRSRVAYWL